MGRRNKMATLEEDYKNLKEIITLCEKEIENNDDDVTAILDITDLRSLKNILECVKNTFDIKEDN